MKQLLCIVFTMTLFIDLYGQHTTTGFVFDSETKEPLTGAYVICLSDQQGSTTNANGHFTIETSGAGDTLQVSLIGYDRRLIPATGTELAISLSPSSNNLQQIIVTANREAGLRTDAPVAISKLSPLIINETKPAVIAELVNKVPGVVMLNYNNEQHGMSIRQPMGTSAYFLYLEDGLPMRPMGVFNHNALIEMNMFSISSLEVVKGPASSLYGPEAVGGAVNFITHRATSMPTATLGLQADHWGYRRIQYAAGGTIGSNVGVYLSGFEGRQRDSWQTSSDYDKSSASLRVDVTLSQKTALTATFSGNEYDSDMAGSVDSVSFYNREYTSTTDFTYRKVHSQRSRMTVTHEWNAANLTSATVGYRDNYIEQVPNYGIRWTSGNSTASVERNRNTFYSKVAALQHRLKFDFLEASLLAGGIVDVSPVTYWAYRIDLAARLRSDGRSVERYTITEEQPDAYLSNYDAKLRNNAGYLQFEINPLPPLKVTLGLRYDKMAFDYVNYLDGNIGNKSFEQLTPKIGATYDLLHDKGLYANYSEGFSPPGLTSIFRKRANPTPGNEFYYNLEPARFRNAEIGGWAAFLDNELFMDAALYVMAGRKELLNIRQVDNSNDYQSAGKTLHRGIEYGVTYNPNNEWFVRVGGTNAVHQFEDFELNAESASEKRNVNGNHIPQSPKWIANTEITYKPAYLNGFRVAVEWQRIGSWYQDQINNVKYDDRGFLGLKGVSYLNLRAGYEWNGFEVFTKVMNLTDELYANAATRGNSSRDRTTYTPSAPRTFVLGLQYSFICKSPSSL